MSDVECSICGHRLHKCPYQHFGCPGWHHTSNGFDPFDHVAAIKGEQT